MYSMGHPTLKDAVLFWKHISGNVFAWINGQKCYPKVLGEKHCPFKILTDHKEYDSENHLSTVNSLHSRVAEWYRDYGVYQKVCRSVQYVAEMCQVGSAEDRSQAHPKDFRAHLLFLCS